MSDIGVLVMAYGGPESLDDVEPYLLDVRGFRETPASIVEEVRERYAQIGGRSPILDRTRAQAAALAQALGDGFDVTVGMRHWHPYIRESVARFADRGIDRAVGVAMAPHYSKLSVVKYFEALSAAAPDLAVAPILAWHLLPGYVEAIADRVRDALQRFPADVRDRVPLIFTAHSLPTRILEWQDPYPDQLRETVTAVMELLGDRPFRQAYQSAAMTPDPWLGPDVADVLRDLAAHGERNVLVAPVGFVCEHVEVLYDIDIELHSLAQDLGVRLERIEMLNDHPTFIAGLAELVRERVATAGWS